MIIYFILLFTVVLAANLARKSKSFVESRFFLCVVFASMVLVAGLRDRTVGTDTGSYVKYFDDIKTFSDVIKVSGQSGGEYGFWLLNWLVHFFSDQYMALFLAIALIVVGCYQWAILKYSEHIGISFFVFITMQFYTFFFNGARQGIACAIYTLAIGPLLERNFKKYLGYILVAFLFHKTAIIMIPVYFIVKNEISIKSHLIIFLTGVAGVFFFQRIIEIGSRIDSRYSSYGTASEGGAYFTVGVVCFLYAFFLFFRKSVLADRERYDLYLNLLLIGTVISIVATIFRLDPSGVLRMTLYFTISIVFLMPFVFKNLKTRSAKIFFSYAIMTCYLIYFTLSLERFSNLTPYTFNPSIEEIMSSGE
jgi:hypothetical protein